MISLKLKSEEEKEIYFIVLYKTKEKEMKNDFVFSENNYRTQNIVV